ncbi:pleckstrin homology domain-containing family S member 1 isoform X2 [Xenopus laevis]|uniref:Pleckstrin homology domain-containing family S member 1 isoform X2 n=1 Tax=Xenopus laevis TaxID=8355 RepID=A0A8J1LBK4_XENLA|nr:pleckstrin homology domain-containing family S member 1 isoform X2 [Xenopus laevis]
MMQPERSGVTPEPCVLYKGYATKSPPEMFFLQVKMWKERLFILWTYSYECNLVYYVTDGTHKRKGVIPIREIKDVMKGCDCNVGDISSIMMIHLVHPENVLLIRTKKRKYYLMNNDKDEIEAWYQHLTAARQWQEHPQPQQRPHPEVSLSIPVPETMFNEIRNPTPWPIPRDLGASLQKQRTQWYQDLKQERPITYPNTKTKKSTELRDNRSYSNPDKCRRPVHENLILPMLTSQSESDPQENSEPDSDEEFPHKNGQPRNVVKQNTFQKKKVMIPTEDLKKYFDVGECLYVTNWKPPNDTGCQFNKGDLIYAINGFRLNCRQMLFDLLKCCTEEEVTLTVLRSRVVPLFHSMGCSCTSPGSNAEAFH